MKWIREMGKAMYRVKQEEGRIEQCREKESSRDGHESRQGTSRKGRVHEKLGNEECAKEWRRKGKTKTGQLLITVAVLSFPVNFVRVHSACSLPSQSL